jgi:DNA primase catalytic subunit
MSYELKYLKYKNKYIQLKNLLGGTDNWEKQMAEQSKKVLLQQQKEEIKREQERVKAEEVLREKRKKDNLDIVNELKKLKMSKEILKQIDILELDMGRAKQIYTDSRLTELVKSFPQAASLMVLDILKILDKTDNSESFDKSLDLVLSLQMYIKTEALNLIFKFTDEELNAFSDMIKNNTDYAKKLGLLNPSELTFFINTFKNTFNIKCPSKE